MKPIRIFTREVDACVSCPNCDHDINITRYICRPTNTFICWMGEGEDKVRIPGNCPLPLKEEESTDLSINLPMRADGRSCDNPWKD